MMKTIRLILGLVLLTALCQCSHPNSHSSTLGDYDLSAHDNSGRLVFTGSIRLASLEQNHLKGQCTIVRDKNAPEGILDNNGPCEALLEGRMVSFDLAPSMDDAGILLEGELNDGRISGVWKVDGFATSEVLGRFEAVKRSN